MQTMFLQLSFVVLGEARGVGGGGVGGGEGGVGWVRGGWGGYEI